MKREIKIKQTLYKAISEYCSMNSIEDVDGFVERCITNGFNTIRFGSSPIDNVRREKDGVKDFDNGEKTLIGPSEEVKKPTRSRKKNPEPEAEKTSGTTEGAEKAKVRKIRIIKKD